MFKRDDVMTTRPASTSLLTIDSEDRFLNGLDRRTIEGVTGPAVTALNVTPYNFVINKPESMMNGFLTRLAVTEIVFPFAIPNVNIKSYQITVGCKAASGDTPTLFNIEIPIGFYTPAALAAAIQSAVRTATGLSAFTMTYGATTGLPFFQYAIGSAGPFNFMAFLPLAYNSATYPYPPTTKQLFDVLGFDATDIGYAAGGAGAFTLAQWCRYVDIVCPQLTYNQPLKDTSSQKIARDSLCRVYFDQTSGHFQANNVPASDSAFIPTGCVPYTVYHNYTLPKQISWTPNQPVPGYLQFQVYDDSGALLSEVCNSQFGVAIYLDWSMTLLVTEN